MSDMEPRRCIYCDEPLLAGETWYHYNNVCDRVAEEEYRAEAILEDYDLDRAIKEGME